MRFTGLGNSDQHGKPMNWVMSSNEIIKLFFYLKIFFI